MGKEGEVRGEGRGEGRGKSGEGERGKLGTSVLPHCLTFATCIQFILRFQCGTQRKLNVLTRKGEMSS